MAKPSPDAIAKVQPRLADGVESERLGDGALRLKGPVLKRGPIRRFFARLTRQADRITVELDDVGAFVVDRLDGRRTLGELAQEVAAYLKLSRREAEAALTLFLRMLLKRRLVHVDLENL